MPKDEPSSQHCCQCLLCTDHRAVLRDGWKQGSKHPPSDHCTARWGGPHSPHPQPWHLQGQTPTAQGNAGASAEAPCCSSMCCHTAAGCSPAQGHPALEAQRTQREPHQLEEGSPLTSFPFHQQFFPLEAGKWSCAHTLQGGVVPVS